MSTAISMMERTNILRKEFLEVELNHDELVSMDQFYGYLDKKAKKTFDRDVGEQLYSRMNKSFNGKISVDEFIKVFLQAEEILKNKIETCKKLIVDHNQKRRDACNKFEEIRDCERINQYGIRDDSTLSIELLRGMNFPSEGLQVIMQLEDQKLDIASTQGPQPIWNKQHQFKIFTGLEELQAFFYTIHSPNVPKLLGTVTISLSRLTNQSKTQEWCQLFDKNGNQITSKILIGLHWIFSEAKHLSQILEQWNESIKNQENDLLDYERDLATLYEPFPSLVQILRTAKNDDLKINHQPLNTMIITPVSNSEASTDLLILLRMSILIIIALSTFICYAKAQFLDIILGGFFILDFQSQSLTKLRYIYYIVAIGISFLLDIMWAAKYSQGFWGTQMTASDQYFAIENGPNRLALILLYIQFVVKLVLIVIMAVIQQSAKQDQPIPQQQLPKTQTTKSLSQRNKTAQFGDQDNSSTYYNY